jgi:rRNA-processing protein FCF1
MNIIPRNPIVDTGPLFDFLIWKFSETIGLKMEKLKYLTSNQLLNATQWYLEVAKPILICPGVIAEINGLARSSAKLSNSQMGSFWTFSQKELLQLGIDEKMIKLVDMDPEILKSYWPIDTAIFHLAQRTENIGKPVFTADGRLRKLCIQKEIKVLGVYEVLNLWQSYTG